MDHVGITVPDLETASRFLVEALGAVPLYDNIQPGQPAQAGEAAERSLNMAPGTRLVRMRMLRLHDGPGIELFEMHGPTQRPAAISSDMGLQHVAVYVDDLPAAMEKFERAGGRLLANTPHEMLGLEKGPGNGWVYARTPWGSTVELISYPGPLEYERQTPLRRWVPPKP